jgi:AraC family transcriptional regulator
MAVQLAPGSFYGQTRSTRELAGFTFAESAYRPPARLPPHAHARPFFYLVLRGVCKEVSSRGTRAAGPATLVFHPAGEVHANDWQGDEGLCFHIEVAEARGTSLRDYAPALDRPADFANGLPPWLALRLYREYRRADGASPLALEGLALEVLAEVARPRPPAPGRHPPPWLVRAREVLHDRLTESLALGEIAADLGVHPAHLARAFRQHFGCTAGAYVRRLRVEDACRKLADTNMSLIEVALATGFFDQSHFTKAFRRQTGMTPAQFRRASRAG